ncbi:MAG: hypothetical protein K7J15_06355 [Candidatus Regiella insecticola]|nr:hypothetical protein [Candidatus Regiella insecticola]
MQFSLFISLSLSLSLSHTHTHTHTLSTFFGSGFVFWISRLGLG